MNYFNKLLVIIASILTLLAPIPASAGEPTSQLKATINEFISILMKTPVEQLRASGLPTNALALIHSRFDFSEMTKRSLGSHWQALASADQRDFVEAFTQKLLLAYGRSVRASGDEKVQYENESRQGDTATVETKVISGNGDELPIDYQMHDVDGQWKVYDMVIDHVSIVSNYHAQFERVIAQSSLSALLQKMKQQHS